MVARRAKRPRFKEFDTFANSFDVKNEDMNFAQYLKNDGPYVVELGCGTAKLSLELARRHPAQTFIAVDIKSDRMWRGAKIALEEGINNLAFIRSNIKDISQIFKPKSLSQIWITFPDPYPRKGDVKRRLTHPNFLLAYQELLVGDGQIKFKTDNKPLFEWSLSQFKQQPNLKLKQKSTNLHQDFLSTDEETIKTSYETRFLASNLPISYAEFQLN